MLPALLAASGALAADADNGKRLAEMRCVTCHIVSPSGRRVVTDAPPFEAIARKFASDPDTLAFSIMDPHPRMNVTLTRREAQDVAAYINTLAKYSTCHPAFAASYRGPGQTAPTPCGLGTARQGELTGLASGASAEGQA